MMELKPKCTLPPPNFDKAPEKGQKTPFLTPSSGMTLLPIYGTRGGGSRIRPRYLQQQKQQQNHGFVPRQQPPEERQFCEACEVELQSTEAMRLHRAQHELCPVEGCKYRGLPSVMDRHVMALHASGLFDKFKRLSTPEEIAAWREERRRKYPTAANVLMRQRAKEQRVRRGERLEANRSRFGKQDDRKRARDVGDGTAVPYQNLSINIEKGGKNTQLQQRKKCIADVNKKRNKRRKIQGKNETQTLKHRNPAEALKDSTSRQEGQTKTGQDIDEVCGGVCMFRGTSSLTDYKHLNVRKFETDTNVLVSMLGMYGSDDDDDEETEIDVTSEDVVGKVISTHKDPQVEMKGGVASQSTEDCISDANSEDLNVKTIEQHVGESNSLQNILVGNERMTSSQCSHKTMLEEKLHALKNESGNASSDEAPEEAPIGRISDLPIVPNSVQQSHEISGQAEIPAPSFRLMKREKSQGCRRKKLNYAKAGMHRPNTMLEKLLETDIRHERNVLLQCVRYVCENKFFDLGA